MVSNEAGGHTAMDLLRQSLTHGKVTDDESHDHILSRTPTPPNGTATPRPDLHDKRLPGLVNSYFAQVRASLQSFNSNISEKEESTTTDTNTINPTHSTLPAQYQQHPSTDSAEPATAIGVMNSPSQTPSEADMPAPHADMATLEKDSISALIPPDTAYPTPPLSSSSSMIMSDGIAPTSLATIAAAPPRSPRKRSWNERHDGTTVASPIMRRNTLCNALSSVLTISSVSAHISNPSAEFADSTLPSQHDSEKAALTTSAIQNTPPQTPRSGSHASRSRDDDATSHLARVAKAARSDSAGSDRATIGQLKGQLEVCIEEARGIRPSVDPYVVCIFQLNEDISGGPKEDEMDTSVDEPPEENLARGVAMKRLGSGTGTPITIPGLRSRQTSQTNIAGLRRGSARTDDHQQVTDPVWRHTTTFDVVGENNEIDISVYDRANNESFVGHVRLPLNLDDYAHQHEAWYKLQSREGQNDHVSGEIHLTIAWKATGKKTFGPDDFEILKLIGKGTFGQVFQVRKKDTRRIYAMKVLSKKVIVQKKEIQHTIGERNILVRTATTESPFIVGLKFSFQTSADLYLVTDYMSGGELFWHLQKEGRFVEERAKFYIAELILALRHLHQHDIVYRDLKPENILLDANGHIALCDFGLSKANLSKNDTTNTFCGTTEYLAPEVLLDEQGYTKMVDFWSLGVLVFEMCCGWSPFYAEDTQQMYKNIAFGKVRFPRDALSQEGRSFVKGLLNRNPLHRLGARGDAEELMNHPFFADVDWTALSKKMTPPPFKPKLKSELDTSNFDPEFTNALAAGSASSLNARAAALASGLNTDSTPLSPTMQNQFKGFTFVDESTLEQQYNHRGNDMDEDDLDALDQNGGERMSGLERTATNGQDDFNAAQFDDI